MTTITVNNRNNFRLGTNKKYAAISLREDGIKIICTDRNPEELDMFVLALNYRSGIIYLPSIIMQAYGLEKEVYNVEVLENDRFFIRKPRLFDVTFEKPLAEEIQAYKYRKDKDLNKNIRGYKVTFSKEENVNSYIYRVDMRFGDYNYVKITSVDKIPEGANTLADLKETYGANLLMYPYNSVSYYVDQSNNQLAKKVGRAVFMAFPTPFLAKWGINNGEGEVEVRHFSDYFVISPVEKNCEITGEKIEPIKEPIKEIRVCGEHADEKNQIKEMVQLIRGISEMCQNIKNNNEQLRSRVEKLEAALF